MQEVGLKGKRREGGWRTGGKCQRLKKDTQREAGRGYDSALWELKRLLHPQAICAKVNIRRVRVYCISLLHAGASGLLCGLDQPPTGTIKDFSGQSGLQETVTAAY